MLKEILESQNITTLAAIVAIIASVVSPVFVALINQIGANCLKRKELFFEQKAIAYKNYITVASEYAALESIKDQLKLHKATNLACMFSSKDTQGKLALYSHLLMFDPLNSQEIALANSEVILAVQKDLKRS